MNWEIKEIPPWGGRDAHLNYEQLAAELRNLPDGKSVMVSIPGNLKSFVGNVHTRMSRQGLAIRTRRSPDKTFLYIWERRR